MLRLKQALLECSIPQKALCDLTGYSKALISRTLSSGALPQEPERFLDGVAVLAVKHTSLVEWLERNNLTHDNLCDIIPAPERPGKQPNPAIVKNRTPDLEQVLCEIAGRAVLNHNASSYMIGCLARVSHHLLQKLTDLAGEGSPYLDRIEHEAVGILSININ